LAPKWEIPTQHLQQALIEERTRVMLPEPSGFLDNWVGPADFVPSAWSRDLPKRWATR